MRVFTLPDRIEQLIPDIEKEYMTTRAAILGRANTQLAVAGRHCLMLKMSQAPFGLNNCEIGRILSRHPSTVQVALKGKK